ncbi:MAG: hypothetical protein KAR56_00725 [Thermoplasmata archaeon]|nr:hypothetical protein [Thermoplasmata archaeon]
MNQKTSWCDTLAKKETEMDKTDMIIIIVAKWLQPDIEYKHLRKSNLYEPIKEKILDILKN